MEAVRIGAASPPLPPLPPLASRPISPAQLLLPLPRPPPPPPPLPPLPLLSLLATVKAGGLDSITTQLSAEAALPLPADAALPPLVRNPALREAKSPQG